MHTYALHTHEYALDTWRHALPLNCIVAENDSSIDAGVSVGYIGSWGNSRKKFTLETNNVHLTVFAFALKKNPNFFSLKLMKINVCLQKGVVIVDSLTSNSNHCVHPRASFLS